MHASNVEEIKNYVQQVYAEFGLNKRQEVARLFYEIAKRERCDFRQIVIDGSLKNKRFATLKNYLLKRRYPYSFNEETRGKFLFPALKINQANRAQVKTGWNLQPRHFFIENAVNDSLLVKQLKAKFTSADFSVIPTYKDHVTQKPFGIKDYNQRLNQFFIVKEKFDFFDRCPCSNRSIYCGYHVVNLGSGCAFECSYCYLQDYINSPGIVIPANLEDFFDRFKLYKQNIRLGSGELTDSLIFDHITGFSTRIVDFFRDYPGSTFEFKTKSNNIHNLLNTNASENIVISWSVNPQSIIEETEFFTASLDDRLLAAGRCAAAGYKIGIHFDPIIFHTGWEENYAGVVQLLNRYIKPEHIAWISLGTLRMTPRLKQIIENRFPENKILDEEFLMDYDRKFRYTAKRRTEMYLKLKQWIREKYRSVPIYLCMEEKEVCGACDSLPSKEFQRCATRETVNQ